MIENQEVRTHQPGVTVENLLSKEAYQIGLDFKFKEELNKLVRNITLGGWLPADCFWYKENILFCLRDNFKAFEGKAWVDARESPKVITKDDEQRKHTGVSNLKHKIAQTIMYVFGLRRSELLNLKLMNEDSDSKLLIIRNSKGKKDCVVPLSIRIIGMLRDYYKKYKPERWLFEGWQKGVKYSEKSLAKVLKNALHLTTVKKDVNWHWVRHSNATHLSEIGKDLMYIQEISVYKSSKPTEIYTHVYSKQLQTTKKPFDDLEI